jgi:hypothetical protein
MYGADTMIRLAHELCEMDPKPTSQQAVTWLRRWRLDQEDKAGNANDLANVLCKAIDNYLERYPSTPRDAVLAALEDVLDVHYSLEHSNTD